MKTAILRLLIKDLQGERINKNYRLVSNLSDISKLIERVGMDQILNHCEQQGLMPTHQSAYSLHYSCETLLMEIHNDVLWEFEKKNNVGMILPDISAAFDTVGNDVLVDVLSNNFALIGMVLEWIKSYLSPWNVSMKITLILKI